MEFRGLALAAMGRLGAGAIGLASLGLTAVLPVTASLVLSSPALALSITGDSRIAGLSFSVSARLSGEDCLLTAEAAGPSMNSWSTSDIWGGSGPSVTAYVDSMGETVSVAVMISSPAATTYSAPLIINNTSVASGPLSVTINEADMSAYASASALDCVVLPPPGGPGDPPPGGPGDPPPVNKAPAITSSNSAQVAENTDYVIDVDAADDSDSESNGLNYSINGGADSALFTVNSGSGVVRFNSAPDYETPLDSDQDNVYEVEVAVQDSSWESAEQLISVTVTDESEVPPNKPPRITSSGAASVAENTTSVSDIDASDDSDSEGSGLSYSIKAGDDAALFAIDDDTGALSFLSAPDFEVPADLDHDNIYEVTVQVTDSGNQSDSLQVVVTITDTDEGGPKNAPPKISGSNAIEIVENETFVADIAALDDADSEGNGLTFRITKDGADSALFSIDTATGALSFRAAPDFENPGDANKDNQYLVSVEVTDSGNLSASVLFTVTVKNVSETGPKNSPPRFDMGSTLTREEGRSSVKIKVSDREDSSSRLELKITGGEDARRFKMTSRKLTFRDAPDFENPKDADRDNAYEVVLTVIDTGRLSTSQKFRIMVIAGEDEGFEETEEDLEPEEVVTRTEQTIASTVVTRIDAIDALTTDLTQTIFFDPSMPVTLTVDPNFQNIVINYAASLADLRTPALDQASGLAAGTDAADKPVWDIWLDGGVMRAQKGNSLTNVAVGTLGFKYLLTPDLAVGVMARLDWSAMTKGNTKSDGIGWVAGPYVAAKLSEQLYFDASLLAGQSYNNISPFGTYTDQFQTDRLQGHAKLSGKFDVGQFTIRPQAGVVVSREVQNAYTDGMGNDVAAQTFAKGTLTLGPAVAYLIKGEGVDYTPNVGLFGNWNFLSSGGGTAFNARVEGGIDLSFEGGASFNAKAFYGGIGSTTVAYGGRLGLTVPLN